MGLLDTKAARARRKPVDSFSGASPARHAGSPLNRAGGPPTNPAGLTASLKARGKPQADRAAVVIAKVRDEATIRTPAPGNEIGFELQQQAIARWPEDLRDLWEERAAILEYDHGLPRLVAERRAYQIVRDANEAALLMTEAQQS